MKKTKLIALTMVIAMMLIGAGYAAWTETLVIDTTVKTGELDVNFSKAWVGNNSDYVTGIIEIDKETNKIATATLENLYPGAHVNTICIIKNDGSIPAKLENVIAYWKNEHEGLTIGSAQITYNDKDGNTILFDNNKGIANVFAENKQYLNTELPVGGTATLGIRYEAGEEIKENQTYKVDIKVEFKQFNK